MVNTLRACAMHQATRGERGYVGSELHQRRRRDSPIFDFVTADSFSEKIN